MQLDRIETKLDRVEDKLDALGERLTRQEEGLTQVRGQIRWFLTLAGTVLSAAAAAALRYLHLGN